MLHKIVHSLRFRVNMGVLLPLLIVLSISSYLRYVNYERLLMSNLERSATNAGEIIESGLQEAMLANDFSFVREMVVDIGEQRDVRDIFMLDKQGKVLISTGTPAVGDVLQRSDVTCQACHRYKATSRNESVILTLAGGERVYRNINAIENGPACRRCHTQQNGETLGVLISDLSMGPVDAALAANRRSSLLWSASSVLLLLIIINLMMEQLVISRLNQFVRAIRRLAQGDLQAQVSVQSPYEYRVLAESLNKMTEGLRQKEKLERDLYEQTQQLKAQAKRLSTLNKLANTLSQSLNQEQIAQAALDQVLQATGMRAGRVFLHGELDGKARLVIGRGIGGDEDTLESHPCTWDQCRCSQVLYEGRVIVLGPECKAASCGSNATDAEGFLRPQICIPLKSKAQVLGIMTLWDGKSSPGGPDPETLEMLGVIGRQVGIAVENARLYEALRQTETRQKQLLERAITAQEQERKRVARELHDQTSQPLSSLIMTLEVLEQSCSVGDIKEHVQELRDIATRVLDQVHDLALELRPSMLDDLGLLAALRHSFRQFQHRYRVPVDFQVLGFDSSRLTPEMETALYRITQEALTNIARHAEARNVGVLLEDRGSSVVLMIEDDGKGFDVAEVMGAHVERRNLGLYGMQERASLVGGTLSIESSPGQGTALFVEIPLE